ncbi:hypothetical protein Goshw_005370, partial [Gossypium schwendimanii]|nr:hypothetical protein [Gossypium schwendimanii]
MEGDATNEVIDGIPSITFFERGPVDYLRPICNNPVLALIGHSGFGTTSP